MSRSPAPERISLTASENLHRALADLGADATAAVPNGAAATLGGIQVSLAGQRGKRDDLHGVCGPELAFWRAAVSTASGRAAVTAEPPAPWPAASMLSLIDAIEGFLLSRRVANCTAGTLGLYAANLGRFAKAAGGDLAACSPLVVQRYLTELRERMRAVTVHQHFRGLRTFFTWCVSTGLLGEHPMRGLTMRTPKTLPRVPEDENVRRLLAVCPETF